ncbi:shikimate kinase [Capnocytophaga sp. HP1101]
MKIILLGYMGSGKTTLGKAIGDLKNISFIDLDSYIAKGEKLSVQEIFRSKGEIYFRKKETVYLKELLQKEEDFVLSLGGGTPCFGNNMALIKQATSLSIYLKYQPKTLAKRLIKEKQHRPLLSEINEAELEDFIRKHLFERNPFYMQANYIISMDNLTEEESISEIEKIL